MKSLTISALTHDLAQICEEQFSAMGWAKPAGYFQRCLGRHLAAELHFLVAHEKDTYAGHARLVWKSNYPPFRAQRIPEIQDLNVLPRYRRRGIGTTIIQRCERIARKRSSTVGIGVGLHPGYNNAQRLYSRLGYVLDGYGVHYDGVPVETGRSYPFDDKLIVYFTKTLVADA